MKKIKKAALIILGVLAVVVAAFLALIYIPSPRFDPVAYEPITPDYWPTEDFQTSTPEEQGMDSARLLEMLDFYEEQRAEDKEIENMDPGMADVTLKDLLTMETGIRSQDSYLCRHALVSGPRTRYGDHCQRNLSPQKGNP